MEVVRLRTLTEKSVIQGGIHAGRRVEELLDHFSHFLVYCYFNYSKISFTEEVLTKLSITEEFRIKKPGKSIETAKKYWSHIRAKRVEGLDEIEIIKIAVKKRKIRKARAKRKLRMQEQFEKSHIFSREARARANRGQNRKK